MKNLNQMAGSLSVIAIAIVATFYPATLPSQLQPVERQFALPLPCDHPAADHLDAAPVKAQGHILSPSDCPSGS